MADFCITAVKYSNDRKHIEWVSVREEIATANRITIGEPRTVARAFVADLIRLGKASFQTRVKNTNGNWDFGAHVHVIEKIYLTTDRNSTAKDNLANLPEF